MGNAASILHGAAERSPDAVAVRCGDATLSYAELERAAGRVAAAAVAHGLVPGDRVLLVGPTVPEWISAYYGLLGQGMVVVAANPMAAGAELEYFLEDSGAALALSLGDSDEKVRAAAEAVGRSYRSLDPGSDFHPDPDAGRPVPIAACGADDLAVLLYTSGTTGRPKGAMLSHGNLTATAEVFADAFRLTPDDGVLLCLPISHVFGQACILNAALRTGARVTLQPRFDATEALALIDRDGLSVFAGVPTMYNALLRTPEAVGAGLGAALRLAISGGAPNPVDILERFEQRFGCPIVEGWGMTESTGAGTFNRLDRPRKVGRVGVALPGSAVRIVDEDDRDVEPGAVGEILLRGPTVMLGYWRRPEDTADTLVDGWLRTGDLGSCDADGDIAIVDRKKDLIIRGGYNVYPREVEEVLVAHPDVVEALVVGIEDPHFGEEVGAAIVARPGSTLDADGIRAWTDSRVSPYKRPRVIRFFDALPRTSTGKLTRRGLDLLVAERESA